MNEKEKANHQKLLKDLSSENLSDDEIIAMWKAPIFLKVHNGFSKYKVQYFLIEKGVSREYAPKAAEQLTQEALLNKSDTSEKTANFLTAILKRATSWMRW